MIEPARFADRRAMNVAGLRRHHAMASAEQTLRQQWSDLAALDPLPGQLEATPYGVFCQAGPEGFEYLAGFEVERFEPIAPSLGRVRVPAQHYAVFLHAGPASALRATWRAILEDWLPGSGRRPAPTPDLEVYAPPFDPATGLGGVEIWFPVERA